MDGGWMNEERVSGRAGTRAPRGRPVSAAASRSRRCRSEWGRKILGGMDGPGAGAWATVLPVGLGFESHDPFSTHPTPAPPALPTSDYIIKEKTVLLQKKDSEGFGFVLRGAKGECRPGGAGGWPGGGVGGEGPQPAHTPNPRVPVPQPRRSLRDLGLSPIPCSASPPPPLPSDPAGSSHLQRRPPSRSSPPPRPSRPCSIWSRWTRVAWHGALDCAWATSSSR